MGELGEVPVAKGFEVKIILNVGHDGKEGQLEREDNTCSNFVGLLLLYIHLPV